jgi:hypothetical protein
MMREMLDIAHDSNMCMYYLATFSIAFLFSRSVGEDMACCGCGVLNNLNGDEGRSIKGPWD